MGIHRDKVFNITGGANIDIDWEPEETCSITNLQINIPVADTSTNDLETRIVRNAGETVFNFGLLNMTDESPATEFTITPENETAIVLRGDKITVDYVNSANLDPIAVIIKYKNKTDFERGR